MRRIPLILGFLVIAGMIVRDVYEFFVKNEGIRYFSSEPSHLLYVMLLGLAGAAVTLGISRLTPTSQRSLKLIALGGFGSLLVAAVAFFGHLLYLLASSPLIEARLWGWIIAAFCSAAVATAFVWIGFRQTWRQTR
jgi:hypothetical protein